VPEKPNVTGIELCGKSAALNHVLNNRIVMLSFNTAVQLMCCKALILITTLTHFTTGQYC